MKILDAAHWLIPWPILVVGLIAIYRFTRGHLDEKPFNDADRRLAILFGRLMNLQGAVGLIYFFWDGFIEEGFPAYRILHAVMMFIAASIPHYSIRRGHAEASSPHLFYFYSLLASFLVMLVGISLIPS